MPYLNRCQPTRKSWGESQETWLRQGGRAWNYSPHLNKDLTMRLKCKTCWKSSTLKRSLLQRRGNWPKLRPGRLQHIPRVLSVPGVLLSLLRKAEQVYSFLTTLVDSFLRALQAEIAPHNPHPSSCEDTQLPSYQVQRRRLSPWAARCSQVPRY